MLLWDDAPASPAAAPAPTPTPAALSYADVPEDAWFREAVAFVTERGLFLGTGEDRFSPAAAAERPDSGDVADWALDAVAWALEAGVMQGDEAGRLRPTAPASRAETAQLLMNALRAGVLGDL